MVDRKEDKEIKRLAEETGGRAFFTSEIIELERSFSQIAHELRNQYMVIYEPSNNTYDSKFRKIEVKLPGKKDMRIRAKDGYKAVPYRSSIAQ
jgi:Ca-activated chloride channel family protein